MNDMPPDIKLEIYQAIFTYAETCVVPEFKFLESKLLFRSIRQDMDRNNEKREQLRAKQSARGKLGGRPRKKSPHSDYLESPEWIAIRDERLKQDNYQCVMCGTGKNLEVHHLTYERLGAEKLEDLRTFCRECHKKVHDKDLKEKNEND